MIKPGDYVVQRDNEMEVLEVVGEMVYCRQGNGIERNFEQDKLVVCQPEEIVCMTTAELEPQKQVPHLDKEQVKALVAPEEKEPKKRGKAMKPANAKPMPTKVKK